MNAPRSQTPGWQPPPLEQTPAPLADGRPSTQEVSADDIDLAGIYERQCAWPELLEHLLAQAEGEGDPERRAQVLCRAADVFERHVGDEGGAFMALAQAVQLAASHERVGTLERLALTLRQLDVLPDILREAAAAATTDAAAAASWTGLARWHRTHAAWHAAADAARNAVACGPSDDAALRELEEAERHLELWQDLTKTLKRRLALWQHAPVAATAGTRAAASSVWAELAAIYDERLNDVERALEACQQTLELDPARKSVAARMERLCEANGRVDLAMWLLDQRRQNEPSRAGHTEAAVRVALTLQRDGHSERACEVLEQTRLLDPANELVLDELAQLYSARGCWTEFVDTCWRHAAVTEDRGVRARLAFEAGRVLQNRLDRADAAAAAFNEALADDPGHLNARRGLIAIHRSRGDHEPLAEALWDLASLSDDREEKLASFSEAAALLRDKLADVARAEAIEARVMELAPAHEGVWIRRLDAARAHGSGSDVERLANEALQAGCATGAIVARLAEARFDGGDLAGALAAFHEADALAAAGVQWRVTWLHALRLAGDARRAAVVAQQLLADNTLGERDRAVVNVDLGYMRLSTNVPAAIAAFNAALTAVPNYVPAFAALAEAHQQQGALHAALPWKWSAFDHATDEDDKTDHALDIVSWVAHDGRDAEGARTVLEHALAHLPRSMRLLDALLDLHVRAQAWADALTVLKRQAALAQGPDRADRLVTAADVAQSELQDKAMAATLLANALDAAPDRTALADRLETLLNEQQDFVGLEQHLRRRLAHIGNAPSDPKAAVGLWQRLARLYQGPLANPDRAVVALQAVARLEGTPAARNELAALLESRGPEGLQAALALRQELLAESRQPRDMVEPLRALARSCGRLGDVARSLRATAAVVALGVGTPQERAMVARQGQAPFVPPRAALPPRAFDSMLAHPDQTPALSTVFAHAVDAAAALHAQPARHFNLPPRWVRQKDPALEQHPNVIRLRHIAATLGVALPPVTTSASFAGLIDLVVVAERRQAYFAVALGENFFAARPDVEFAFLVARCVARLRREHLVTWPHVVPVQAELEAVVAAARRLAGQTTVGAADARLVSAYVVHLRHALPPHGLQSLVAAAAALPPAADVGLWLRGAALTMNRAALLVADDVTVALAHAQPDALAGVAMPPAVCTRDVILWSVSDAYATVRRELI